MMNLAVFKRIGFAAALAGLFAGLLLTVVQLMQVSPIILQAETYEEAATSPSSPAASPSNHDDHAHHDGGHEHEEWQPENGWERSSFTALANISQAVGFGLFLGAAFCLRKTTPNWRSGLLWGLAGYAIFFVAPSLGLPPELPGTNAAPLSARQTWWTMTVVATAAGLFMLVFAKSWKLKLLAAVLLALPHMVGAPHPPIHSSTAPADLAQHFIYATAIANALFWLALGSLMGFFYKRMV